MPSHSTWTDHFPGNFMWSNAMLVCKGMAPYGAVAPTGTPKDAIAKLHQTLAAALAVPELREQLINQGAEPVQARRRTSPCSSIRN